jgi:hypothetical protein
MSSSTPRTIYFTVDSSSIQVPESTSSTPPSSDSSSSSSGGCLCCCKRSTYSLTAPILSDTIQIDLPSEFIFSNHQKFISVNNVRCINVENEPFNVFGASCCSNLIQDNPYGDYFLSFCDDTKPFIKRIPIYDAKTKFNIWFKDAKAKIIDLDPRKNRIVMELLLEF